MRKLMLLSLLLGVGAAVIAAVTAFGAHDDERIRGLHGTIWAVERFDTGPNTLAALDAATGEVLGVVQIGRRPIGVTSPHGTNKVYTADERSNQLTVVSKDDFSIVTRIATGAFPHHIMASRNGKRIYVGEYGTNKVGVVDTDSDTLAAEWEASANPTAKTHAVWITNNGRELYATNEGTAQADVGTLSKLDARTGERLWEVPIGRRPSEVLVTRDGDTAYVTVRNENVLRALDVSGDAPAQLAETVVGGQPDTMQLTDDGDTLVVGLRSVPQMALVDTKTLEVRHVTFMGYGISGHQWLSANDRYTFIALESTDTTLPGAIGVVDNRTAEVVTTFEYPGGPLPARRVLRATQAAVAQPPGEAPRRLPRPALRRGAEALLGSRVRAGGLALAVTRRRGCHERVDQPPRRRGDLVDGALEGLLVGPRRLRRAADLAHELQRRLAHLLVGRRRLEVVERLDVAAHCVPPLGSVASGRDPERSPGSLADPLAAD